MNRLKSKIRIHFTILGIAIFLFISSATVASCRADNNQGNLDYEVVRIEGMTCILWNRSNIFSYKAGLTCNWNEYRR